MIVVEHGRNLLVVAYEREPISNTTGVVQRHRDSPNHQLHDVACLIDLLFPEETIDRQEAGECLATGEPRPAGAATRS
jgi:hypothetical protein